MARLDQAKIDDINSKCNDIKVTPKLLAKKMLAGEFELDDLTSLDDDKKILVEEEYDKLKASLPNEDEQQEWKDITTTSLLRDKIKKINNYKRKWNNLKPSGNHLDEAQSLLLLCIAEEWKAIEEMYSTTKPQNWKELLFEFISTYEFETEQSDKVSKAIEYVKLEIVDQWQNLKNQYCNSNITEYINKISSFISKYKNNDFSDFASDVLKEATEELKRVSQGIEQEEWNQVDIRDYDAILSYLQRHINSVYQDEADDAMWSIADNNVRYLHRYVTDMPKGKHIYSAEKKERSLQDWIDVQNKNDIFLTHKYMIDPYSPYINEAVQLFEEQKDALLTDMRDNVCKYDIDNFMMYYERTDIFSKTDFINYNIATEGILRKLEVLKESHESVNAQKFACDSGPMNHTDIIFFGIPSSGKTCVLMGLLAGDDLDYKRKTFGGDYGEFLERYRRKSITPPRTEGNFVSLIQCDVIDKKVIHPVSLIEVAGEAIAEKLAHDKKATVNLDDLGLNITKIMKSPNKKAIFFVIDPTSDDITIDIKGDDGKVIDSIPTSQANVISRIIELLGADSCKDILLNTDSIHFIMTKADTQGESNEREENARRLVINRYKTEIKKLSRLCTANGNNINRTSKNLPMLYTFSLGKFYIGNLFEYDSRDADNIIEVIKEVTRGRRERTLWEKFKTLLNS